ncbi:hypothetical protein BKA00_002539 [Actinomadura coerulea]|uniref:SH3 domain-containing protein n=1 Tax=Actinomadura coerulea TaxID=46159 RepID=A0A7X0KYP4_9ACTN|nr:hypothetical protein [Actinomadura coerulea]MBB6395625.1 hypothetical protein [Actinomadura coerulea]GGQ25010.1 hypothetical protein GCM10010187_46780 [Actinomadura coerulea]
MTRNTLQRRAAVTGTAVLTLFSATSLYTAPAHAASAAKDQCTGKELQTANEHVGLLQGPSAVSGIVTLLDPKTHVVAEGCAIEGERYGPMCGQVASANVWTPIRVGDISGWVQDVCLFLRTK